MSESSDDEFEGFNADEIRAAEQRYNQILLDMGIGDDFEVSSDEEGVQSDVDDENNVQNVDAAGDRLNDGWHENFNYYERGFYLIYLYLTKIQDLQLH